MSSRKVDIPNYAEWSEETLEGLCSVVSRGTAPLYVEDSAVRAIGQRCVAARGFRAEFARPHSEKAMTNVLMAVVGDVLLNSTGTGTIGRSCVLDDPNTFIVDGHVTVLRPPDYETGVWLNAVLRTPWAQGYLERFCYSGSTNQVELNNSALRDSSIPLPVGKERQAIAKALSAINAAIKAAENSIEKMKQMKRGLLHDLLTRGIDSNGEIRPNAEQRPELYKPSSIGLIPKAMEATTVGEALAGIDAGWSPSCPEETPSDGEWGVLKVSAITGGEFRASESKRLPPELRPDPSIEVRNGDVLLARANGVADLVGTTVFVQFTRDRLMLSDKTLRLNAAPGKMRSMYLAAVMQDPRTKKQIGSMLNGSSGQKNISQQEIRRIIVAYPKPDEQRLAELQIRQTEDRIVIERSKQAKLNNLKVGLTEDLLTGRIRVTSLLEK